MLFSFLFFFLVWGEEGNLAELAPWVISQFKHFPQSVVKKSEKPLNVQLKEVKSTFGLDSKEVKAELGKSSFIRMVWAGIR